MFAATISFGLGFAVRGALILAKGSAADIATGLGMFAVDRPMNDPLRSVLDIFDLFALWGAFSLGVAAASLDKLSRGVTLSVSFAVYFLIAGGFTVLRILG